MTLQNRVTPEGKIIADPARGGWMGNRGILHDDNKQLLRARWRHKAWIICKLDFKGRHRDVMAPNHYTELFFLDEATALAAGHRPCAECRRAAFNAYRDALDGGALRAHQIDAQLHRARLDPSKRQKIIWEEWFDLPDGCFVRHEGQECVIWKGSLHPYSPCGYGPALPRPTSGLTAVLTPAPSLTALRNGYVPQVAL